MNLYSYVENNPLNATDPYGLKTDLNFFGIHEPQYSSAMNYKENKDWFSVAGHGNPIGGIYDSGLYTSLFLENNATMISVPVEKLAEYIKKHPRYKKGMGVELLGCETGVILPNNNQYIQKLANALNAPAKGTDKFIWFFPNGGIKINSPIMINNEVKINEKEPGKFNIFYPKK